MFALQVKQPVDLHEGHVDFLVRVWYSDGFNLPVVVRVIYRDHDNHHNDDRGYTVRNPPTKEDSYSKAAEEQLVNGTKQHLYKSMNALRSHAPDCFGSDNKDLIKGLCQF